jgi:peptidoglycan hydrolase-like protein with peptidoglycan-binding domain
VYLRILRSSNGAVNNEQSSTKPKRLKGLCAASLALAGAAAVVSSTAAGTARAEPLIYQGAHGQAVSSIQQAVGGYADGLFGPLTAEKVVQFQKQKGLLVDGVVGPQTRGALSNSNSGHTQPPNAGNSHPSVSRTSEVSNSSSDAGSGYALPASIVMCESRGNYHAVNPSTGAGGAYQIEPATWRAYGGTGQPQNAPKSEQDRIAAKIYHQSGSSQWQCK